MLFEICSAPPSVSASKGLALPPGLKLTYVKCVGGEKDTYLYYFLREFPGRTIVFTNSIDQAKRVAHLLQVTESGEEGRGRLCEE